MSEKVCVVCLEVISSSVATAPACELDDSFDSPPTLHDILPGSNRQAVCPDSFGLCPEHHEFFKEGLVAVIECFAVRNQDELDTLVSCAEGRTGNILYLPKEAMITLINFPPNNAAVFCEREMFTRIMEKLRNVWS